MINEITPAPLAFATIAMLIGVVGCKAEPPLANLGQVPTFDFTDQDGAPIGSASLSGRPYAVNFLFTSCPTACPPLAKATAELQTKVKGWAEGDPPPVQIVSITLDPATDTPEVLKTYGGEYKADFAYWKFARGDYPVMEKLVTEGFMQPIIRKDLIPVRGSVKEKAVLAQPIPLDTAHALRFVLVDGQGAIRGLYNRDDAELERLSADLQRLTEEP